MTQTDTPSAPPRPQRLALVTGASRGLGFALARELGAAGWHVLAVARTSGGLEELDDAIQRAGGNATLAPLDITDDGAMTHLAQSIHDRWGALDLWVHAAIHAAPLSPAAHLDPKDFDKSVACNLRATAGLIVRLEGLLRRAEGAALFLDDPRAGEPFFGAYGSTKGAQICLAKSWQAENARIGPKVLIETPNPLPTATRARFFPGEDRAKLHDTATEARRILTDLSLI